MVAYLFCLDDTWGFWFLVWGEVCAQLSSHSLRPKFVLREWGLAANFDLWTTGIASSFVFVGIWPPFSARSTLPVLGRHSVVDPNWPYLIAATLWSVHLVFN